MLLGLSAALLVLIFDQTTKYYVMNHVLSEYGIISYSSFFNLVRAWNTGVSFSMFNNWGNLGIIVLSAVALTIVGFLLYWLYSEKVKLIQVSLGFIIGGAIGNVIDRIRLGAVFDFLDFHIGEHHWPAFNIADSFICLGAALIVLHGIFALKNKESEGTNK